MKKIYDPGQDPEFVEAYIDLDESREREGVDGEKIPYRFIHGGFRNTNVKFGFSFPRPDKWEGRFFQHLSPFPGPDEEIATQGARGEGDPIGFALTHGAAFVESNMGSSAVFGQTTDPTIYYRSSAAVAAQCRKMTQEIYGDGRVYGYVFGGSGGGFKTMSCIENTNQFDDAVPFVIGSPMSLPNCLTICAFANRRLRHCRNLILDHVEPGSGKDLYDGLTPEEAAALREVISMGIPPRTLIFLAYPEADGSLPVLTPAVKQMDSTYFRDFWEKPGYEGYDRTDGVWEDLTDLTSTVLEISTGASAQWEGPDDRNGTDTAWQKMLQDGSASWLRLSQVPTSDYLIGIDIIVENGAAAGKRLRLGRVEGDIVVPGMSYGADSAEEVLSQLKPGDKVILTNRDYLAIQHYHRHQVPEDTSFHAWDQYRNTTLAQRPVIAQMFTAGGCGSVQDGQIQGKVIVMNNLMDADFPWQADWYAGKIRQVNGSDAEEMFRLWYNDNCPHGDVSEMDDPLHYTSYLGMLCQALLDLSAWVEKGIQPAPNSKYHLENQQVMLVEHAAERGGTQPIVRLTAGGEKRVEIRAGETVRFLAEMDGTEYTGVAEQWQWSFENEKKLQDGAATASHRYDKPGIYFPTVVLTTNRNPGDGYTRLRNLDRMRVIVKEG